MRLLKAIIYLFFLTFVSLPIESYSMDQEHFTFPNKCQYTYRHHDYSIFWDFELQEGSIWAKVLVTELRKNEDVANVDLYNIPWNVSSTGKSWGHFENTKNGEIFGLILHNRHWKDIVIDQNIIELSCLD